VKWLAQNPGDDESESPKYVNPRGQDVDEEVRSTKSFGSAIVRPPHHFSRVFVHFSSEELGRLLRVSLEFYRTVDVSDYTLEQMIAFLWDSGLDYNSTHDWGGPADVDLNEVTSEELRTIVNIAGGRHTRGVATILANTLLDPTRVHESEFDDVFRRAFGHAIVSPAVAVAVASCVQHSRTDFDRFENTTNDLLGDSLILPEDTFQTRGEKETFRHNLDELEALAKAVRLSRPNLLAVQTDMVRPEELYHRFHLEEVASGLFVPKQSNILIARSMNEAVRQVRDSKEAIRDLSPREFEQFLAHIFEQLGFEVELTKASRDGGADLLCLRQVHGLKFRLAVEVKRYLDTRPVNVSLVRAFVGANQQHRANQLLFVTTSSYTAPAVEYAREFCSPHFLALKDYDQIREWCRTVLSDNPKII
jgi:hypothetical protein